MKILVTGGTVFVSRYTAEYFAKSGHTVYVLNRGTHSQSQGVHLIKCDRHKLNNILKEYEFDAVIDVTAYNADDVSDLLNALGRFDNYILISSSAVYPETCTQPFHENMLVGSNRIWGDYGLNKIAAECYAMEFIPQCYIIRPPYLYGQMNNLYREAFVFERAEQSLPFYIPHDGKMPLQFFHIHDLCRFIEILIYKKPQNHVFNVGNSKVVNINEWVKLCYEVLGKTPEIKYVEGHNQRDYFPFYDYGYVLDVSRQISLMPDVKPIDRGLHEAYEWWKNNRNSVRTKPLSNYINKNFH